LLFGASRAAQLDENIGALALANTRADDVLELVGPLAIDGAAPPALFDVSAGRY
jgi:aryl-alcohol dehydrogenase-like predicted oxidoreductase